MKKMFRKSRILSTLGLSIFAVFVTAISTFAWFQITPSGSDPTHSMVSGSSNININSVTGFKHAYGDLDANTIDYSSGTTTQYTSYGTRTTTEQTIDEIEVDLDIPSEGTGYYIMGDADWATNAGYTSDDAWKYKAAKKLVQRNNGTSQMYYRGSVSISENEQIRIQNHYFDASGKTANAWATSSTTTVTGDNVTKEGNNIKITASSTYNVWFDATNNKVCIELTDGFKTNNLAPKARFKSTSGNGINKKQVFNTNDGSGYDYIYLWLGNVESSSNNWSTNSARIYAEFTFSDSSTSTLELGWLSGSNDNAVWRVSLSTLTKTPSQIKFIRKNSAGSSVWNETSKGTFYTDRNFFRLTGWSTHAAYGYNDTWYVKDGSTDYQTADQLYLYSTMATYNGNEITSASNKSINFTKDSQIKVYKQPLKRLFHFADYENNGDSTWYNASGHISDSNGYFTAVDDGVGGTNVKANKAVNSVAFTFTYTNDSTYTYAFAYTSYTVTYHYYKQGFDEVSATEDVSLIDTEVAFAGTTFTAKAVPTISGYTKYGWYESSSLTGSTWSSGTLTGNKDLYAKYVEDPITIYLVPYFSNTASGADGSADDTMKITIDDQYGSASTVTPSALHTLWNGTYADSLTHTYKYDFSRIETSAHTSAFSSGTVTDGTTLYVRYIRKKYTLTLKPSYFLSSTDGGDQLNITTSLDSSYSTADVLDGNTYSTSPSFSDTYYFDETNAIWYVFQQNESTWYTNPECTSAFSGTPDKTRDLYAKMVARPLKTVYFDCSTPSWNVLYIYGYNFAGASSSTGSSWGNTTIQAKSLMSTKNLYRISLPSDAFIVAYCSSSGNSNKTSNISSSTATNGAYLKLDSSSPHGVTAYTNYAQDTGKFHIFRASDSTLEYVTLQDAYMGDSGSKNLLAYEEGVILHKNDLFCLERNSSYSTTMEKSGASSYDFIETTGSGDGTTYVTYTKTINGGSRTMLKIITPGKYTIYLTRSGPKIALAPVPVEGNGYYIMKNTGTKEGYANATKMSPIASGTNKAVYKNYEVTANDVASGKNKLYIRGYWDNVDTLYQSKLEGGSFNDTTAISTAGLYNIFLYDTGAGWKVSIARTTTSDFWKLNTLAADGTDVKSQNTSMVIEVIFTCSSIDSTNIYLEVIGKNANLGVGFYVTGTQLPTNNSTDPYKAMRADHYSLSSNTAEINSSFATTSGDTSKLYYGYIIIDYSSKNIPPNPNYSLTFQIKGVQA